MTGSYITEQHTFKFRGSVQYDPLNMTVYKLRKDDLSRYYDLYFLNNFNNWSILSKVNDATNNRANTVETNIANQEHQNYYDRRDQQYIGHKYNGGLKQVTLELVPDIILDEEKEEEDWFRQ